MHLGSRPARTGRSTACATTTLPVVYQSSTPVRPPVCNPVQKPRICMRSPDGVAWFGTEGAAALWEAPRIRPYVISTAAAPAAES